MWKSKSKQTDPLLPAYDPAPEISGHNHVQSAEIHNPQHSYGSIDASDIPTLNQAYVRDPRNFKNWRTADNDDDNDDDRQRDEEPSSSVANTMGRIYQAVFVFIFFAVLLGAVSSYFRSDRDPNSPFPPSAPHDPSSPSKPKTLHERANAILTSTPLIDGHNDLAIFIRGSYQNNITSRSFRTAFEHGPMAQHVDLPRLRTGKAGGAFWSSFALCPPNASYDMSDANYASSVSHTLEQIDLLRRLQSQYPSDFSTSTTPRAAMLAAFHTRNALFGPISIEGLHQIPPTAPMSALRSYYALGVRMATLTWNCHNPFADACLVYNTITQPPVVVNAPFRPQEGALTARGRAVVREMNRLGMIVDISHTSYWTQKAVLSDGASRAPVVFSHSSAYRLCPHPRNVRDDILDLVKDTNSVVMVNFSPDFVSCVADDNADPDADFSIPKPFAANNTLHQVARHVVYIGRRIGWNHVGIGSDYDGMAETPRGLEGVDKYPDLVAELLRMGVGDEDAKKIVGGNVLRVWREVDEVAARMVAEGVEPGLDSAEGW